MYSKSDKLSWNNDKKWKLIYDYIPSFSFRYFLVKGKAKSSNCMIFGYVYINKMAGLSLEIALAWQDKWIFSYIVK